MQIGRQDPLRADDGYRWVGQRAGHGCDQVTDRDMVGVDHHDVCAAGASQCNCQCVSRLELLDRAYDLVRGTADGGASPRDHDDLRGGGGMMCRDRLQRGTGIARLCVDDDHERGYASVGLMCPRGHRLHRAVEDDPVFDHVRRPGRLQLERGAEVDHAPAGSLDPCLQGIRCGPVVRSARRGPFLCQLDDLRGRR